ncbi:uncharacterized protein LOC133800453 [Humulus lupulus]|uniref:uncharacterized protein LOC133800453 n=1 Tax=Humulus lupulus TaxID=3486 RepID=UPI002B40A7E7|nr:uncharacterized protein LOC133800453 [Humulus lupulus]
MAQEDYQDQMCSSSGSGSGGKGPKKRNKAPQRGLGVAQLEKIISEEQHKKGQPASDQLAHHNVAQQRGYSELFSPHKEENTHTNNPIWPFSGLAQRTLAPAPPAPEPPQYQLPYSSTVNMPRPTWVAPEVNFQIDPHYTNYSSLHVWQEKDKVIVPQSTWLPSELFYNLEPPSNQSYNSNYTQHVQQEKEEMVSRKRQYPFVDNPPVPSFNLKKPTFYAPTIGDGSSFSYGNEVTFINPEHGSSNFRDEYPSSSCPTSIPKLSIRENNSASKEDFLALGRPTTTAQTSSASKLSLGSFYQPFPNYNRPHNFGTIPVQGTVEEPIFQHGLISGSSAEQLLPLHNLFPPPAKGNNHEAVEKEKSNGTSGGDGDDENIDLTLKL